MWDFDKWGKRERREYELFQDFPKEELKEFSVWIVSRIPTKIWNLLGIFFANQHWFFEPALFLETGLNSHRAKLTLAEDILCW